jgi:hypothetical protein
MEDIDVLPAVVQQTVHRSFDVARVRAEENEKNGLDDRTATGDLDLSELEAGIRDLEEMEGEEYMLEEVGILELMDGHEAMQMEEPDDGVIGDS